MAEIKPFTIAVPEAKLLRLKQKLELTDFPPEVEGVEPWTQGSPLADIKRLTSYWANGFDWRAVEAKLNQLPQFTTNIEVEGFSTYDVHFIHQRSTVKNAIPLLFIHGWPGSFIEVTRLIGELIKGGADYPAFHVVAPSLIDFGFSAASKNANFNIDQHAETCHKLMMALGYEEYVLQAGDVGCLISRFMAQRYGPKHVKAQLLNNVAPAEPKAETHPELHARVQATPLTPAELAGLGRTGQFEKEGNGYYRKQATKPQTVAYFMTDSPAGFLAWIYECLHDWTDNYVWTDDEILTWISIYYLSKPGPAATSFIYYAMDHRNPNAFAAAGGYADVPVGISRFSKDLLLLPKLWNHTLGPVVFEKDHEKGGHFASWERPDAIIADLRTMFGKDGGAYDVVKGKNGYE